MPGVRVEHNLSDRALVEVLEKALGEARKKIPAPARKFDQPVLESLSGRVKAVFDVQMKKMLKRVEAVLLD
jgi:hypothetical protein